MSVDSTSTLSDAMQTYYDNRFLKTVAEKVVMDQVCQKRPYKLHTGKTIDWFRYMQLAAVTAHLTEGANGTESNILGQNVTATLKEMGAWYKPSSFLKLTSRDRNLVHYVDVAADQMARSYDMKLMWQQCLCGGYPIRADNDSFIESGQVTTGGTDDFIFTISTAYDDDDFKGGRVIFTDADGPNYAFASPICKSTNATDKLYCGGDATYHVALFSGGSEYPELMEAAITTADAVRVVGAHDIAATDVISSSNIRLALRAMHDNKAQPIDGKYFVGIVDPYVAYDLMGDTTWANVQTYKDHTDGIFKGEIGMLWGIRWIMTTQPWRHAVDSYQYSASGAVHTVPIMGKEALGCTDLKSQGKHIMVKTPGPHSTDNPLEMFSTVGWKFMNAARTLNAFFSVNLLVGATA